MGITKAKTKVTKADIVVRMAEKAPYYVIVYHEIGKSYDSEGYGSYILENVLHWREQHMELVCENENIKEDEQEDNKMLLECKVCNTMFPALRERRYTARDETETGLAAALGKTNEGKLYDAFDCPHCGCQHIVQERKRSYHEETCNCCEEETDGAD